MEYIQKGAMRPIKKILGFILLIAGIGLVLLPDQTAEFLCGQKMIFGILTAIAGYFHIISGRRL